MKKAWYVLVVLPLVLWGRKPADNGLHEMARPEIAAAVARAAQMPHPRLFSDAAGFTALRERASHDAYVRMGVEQVRARANRLLDATPVTRKLEGIRLLGVSQKALYRINTLAMAYRLFGRKEHLERALAELRAVCAFTDWHPQHFLDTAEMSLAVATGYDWLHEYMDAATRKTIAEALRRKGLEASRIPSWWVRAGNNWGQVCHAGILSAALALAEENPDETARMVQRCVDNLPLSMKALAPNGNFPEGPEYWNYGVMFNVVALMLLEGTLGNDFGLMGIPGFRETAQYPDLVTGPSGKTFNYADGCPDRHSCFATWWFARRFNRPDLVAYFEQGAFREACRICPTDADPDGDIRERMFVYGLFSVQAPSPDLKPNLPLAWNAGGSVPITVQRSSWDRASSLFVGIKGGSPSFNHGHMDGGSFILEAQGVRWAIDLGAERYHKIESAGLNLWDMAQTGDRWKVYRLGTSAHNELMLDGCPQFVRGFGKVVELRETPPTRVTFDLTSLYTNATQVLRRGVMAADGRSYELTDSVKGLRKGAPIRWAMTTRAAVTIEGDEVVLRQEGESLRLAQTGPLKSRWRVAPARGPNTWDSENEGCSQITFTVSMPEEGTASLGVMFRVGSKPMSSVTGRERGSSAARRSGAIRRRSTTSTLFCGSISRRWRCRRSTRRMSSATIRRRATGCGKWRVESGRLNYTI